MKAEDLREFANGDVIELEQLLKAGIFAGFAEPNQNLVIINDEPYIHYLHLRQRKYSRGLGLRRLYLEYDCRIRIGNVENYWQDPERWKQ